MNNIIDLKEKLKNISEFLEKIENKEFSKIEKDIFLQMLRDYYLEVTEFQGQSKQPDYVTIVKAVEPEKIEKSEELAKSENVESFDIDFIDNTVESKSNSMENDFVQEIQEKEKVEEKQEEKHIEIKPQPSVKKIVVEQTSLFGANNSVGVKTVGESLGQNKTSLNESLANKSNSADISVRLRPVTDIKSAIGVGDRFLYVRELFAGNSESFEETVAHLNSLNSYQDAKSYLGEKFRWDESQSTVNSFLNIVKRRYV